MTGSREGMRNVALVGFMATGKTCVGRILAERLGWPSVDADEEIERRAGKTIPDIFGMRAKRPSASWKVRSYKTFATGPAG